MKPEQFMFLGVLPLVVLMMLGFSAHDSGAIEPVTCSREVQYSRTHAKLTDRFNKGYVEVGFEPDVGIQEATAILDGLGAHWSINYPFQRHAWVCTRPGEEQKWENILEDVDNVQFVHQEGIDPLSIVD